MMQDTIAPVNHIRFEIEMMLERQIGTQRLPFAGMDKSGSAVCEFFLVNRCINDALCPFRHVRGEKSVVCKHWLRGLCKKGDDCEFLHEYDMSKMPECYFFARFGQCMNKECPFLHIDPEQKVKDCPWYDRGFCRHGPHCKNRHVRRVICQNYVCGFCPEGRECKFVHPRFDIPDVGNDPKKGTRSAVVCHNCGEAGHKISNCFKLSPEERAMHASKSGPQIPPSLLQQWRNKEQQVHRPIEEVTCFKCGDKGHYANKCPRGHLAFLKSK